MVLVTGGTGLVGSHLILHLLEKNVPVRAIYRDGSNLERVQKIFSYYTDKTGELFQKIDWVRADLNDISALDGAFKNIDSVYHAAALISFNPKDYHSLKKINALGTANIVNLCLSNGIKKLCYVSTIGAVGRSINGKKATEENDWTGQDANVYALTKYRAEMEVWRGSQEGLPVVIVNPGVIIGPGFWESGSGDLFTTANKGYSYYPPGGTGFITVNDVVKMMIALMDSTIENQRYIAVSQNHSYGEILTKLCPELGKKVPTKELKVWQLQMGRVFDFLRHLFTGSGRKITKKAIHSLLHPEIYDNQKIREALAFEFEPLEETIRFSCQKFIEENP